MYIHMFVFTHKYNFNKHISYIFKITQNIISAHEKFCDLKQIGKKAKIRSSQKSPDIQYIYADKPFFFK